MEKRRRSFQATSQPECMEDLEGFSVESYSPTSGRKKEPSKSNFFRITAVVAFLVIVSIMFFSGNVTERLSSFGLTKEAATPKYEIDIDMNKPDLQSPALKARAADMIQNSKIEIIRALNRKCQLLIEDARKLKQMGAIMETDENAVKVVTLLQQELRTLLKMRFGENPRLLVEMVLQFPVSMIDIDTTVPTGTIVFELASTDLVPYSVYNFLEIVRRFQTGSFHRNAGHVLQAQIYLGSGAEGDLYQGQGLAFQEYHENVPHKKLSLGYAGRPGGPAFYISTVDNSKNHGPGSQGSKTEADSCFGQIISGEEVVNRMKHQPGGTPPSGFISSYENFITIKSLKLMSPFDAGSAMYPVVVVPVKDTEKGKRADNVSSR